MTARARFVTSLLAVGSALILAGCGDDEPAPGPSPTSTTSAAASSSPTAPASTGSTVASSGASDGQAAGRLVLETDGLGVLTGTSIRHITFGSDVKTLTLALEATVGPVTRQTLPECGQGARVQLARGGFSALVNGADFVGWTDSGRSTTTLTTVSGIGVGSTLAQVRAAYADVTVSEGSLGPEWYLSEEGLGGLLDGTDPTSKVSVVYAGETCFFR